MANNGKEVNGTVNEELKDQETKQEDLKPVETEEKKESFFVRVWHKTPAWVRWLGVGVIVAGALGLGYLAGKNGETWRELPDDLSDDEDEDLIEVEANVVDEPEETEEEVETI